ncbi:NEDD8-activating enzyme E1 regulatory subunit-like [Stegodyphus dumicola]|uniref:NEDD8-activating enzyme E1 regulatory subunit-like n=1 Tax=Stegodyphus dumicola TaxID=202533 RepID=UPI0015A8FFB8|nr:NEDD8-activating enzyme E1 regulatory subunit-like [Stegodyphus dumicola]
MKRQFTMAFTGDSGITESAKRIKYDRQLRLWDDHGQNALESAHVCIINATATGTEILKSLVLPGIGAFTILDSKLITGEDAGNNFFLDKESIGKSRAKTATEHLLELNPDVRGEFVDESVEFILQAEPNFFCKFSVVIVTDVEECLLLNLAQKLWDQNVPLLICRAYGLIGYLRLQVRDRTIIETRPENEFHDLRLDAPFPALKEYAETIDLDKLTDQEHAHVPFVIILLKFLDIWKNRNNGEIPKNMKEKNLFKAEIQKSMRKKDEEENFEEACRAVNRSVTKTTIPGEIQEILNDPMCEDLSSESKSFWILVKALKEFVENEGNGCLPVRGVIPDMTSNTQSYIKLQNIYKTKAEEDAHNMYVRVQEILCKLGKASNFISKHDVKIFCKNAHCLRVLRGRSLKEEYDATKSEVQNMVGNLEHEDSDIIFYVLLRAVDRFNSEYCRYPGRNNDDVESDIIKLKNCVSSLMQEWGCSPVMKDDYIHEMCRFGAAELHSVAAFVGGCAAQEVIKLITGQYVPFNNTVIYYALNQTTSVFYL